MLARSKAETGLGAGVSPWLYGSISALGLSWIYLVSTISLNENAEEWIELFDNFSPS